MRTAHASKHVHLGDFTVRPRMLALTGLALVVGGATLPCRLAVQQEQTLRQVAYLFAETGLTSAPVIDPATRRPTGVITLPHLLHARLHDLTEEHHRERVLPRPTEASPTRARTGAAASAGAA
jgi:hypothetical protein